MSSAPDIALARRTATGILLCQDIAGLRTQVNHLRYDRRIVFDSMTSYIRATGINPYDFFCHSLTDGCTLRRGDLCLVLYNDRNVHPGRLAFTLAHEVGHIYLNHADDSHKNEAEANAFASQLLMPLCVVDELSRHMSLDSALLARLFGVSKAAAGQALRSLPSRFSKEDQALLVKYTSLIQALIQERKSPA